MGRITWGELEALVTQLALSISMDGYRPDMIIAVACSGFTPAHLLATRLDVRLMGAVGMRYTDASRTKADSYCLPWPVESDRSILLVTHTWITGNAVAQAVEWLMTQGAPQCRVAALYVHRSAMTLPNYFLEITDQLPEFPWQPVPL